LDNLDGNSAPNPDLPKRAQWVGIGLQAQRQSVSYLQHSVEALMNIDLEELAMRLCVGKIDLANLPQL
jgi:hypothetical protein